MHPNRKHSSTIAAALAGLLFAIALPASSAAEGSDAWAAGLKNLTPEQGKTLLRIARDLFQHQELADSSYTQCIDPYDAKAGDPKEKAAMDDMMQSISDAARRMGYKTLLEIRDDDERVRISRMLAESRALRPFKKSVEQCLYGQADVKEKLHRN